MLQSRNKIFVSAAIPRFLRTYGQHARFQQVKAANVKANAQVDVSMENSSAQEILVKGFRGMREVIDQKQLPNPISDEQVSQLEKQTLDGGLALPHVRRFNDNLANLKADELEQKLRPVFGELVHNLESFNPAFTAVLLKVQQTIGVTDYVRRDMSLKNLIQPLAGEYGMHNNQQQSKTHRELFADFYYSIFQEDVQHLLNDYPQPQHSITLYNKMMNDILSGGNNSTTQDQAIYALGYNLAIEYLADYEKTWMLESFKQLNQKINKNIDWIFLEIHAEGEKEHAQIGHAAVTQFVEEKHVNVLRKGMLEHDKDFSLFYKSLADMLE